MPDKDRSPEADEFPRLVEIVRELRERCPWDREQTLQSAAKYVVEEAYEAADALRRGGAPEIADELGDLFVQAIFATAIAAERGLTTLPEVLKDARDKLVRRHPHVYGSAKADTVEQVLENWQHIKREERGAADTPASSLADVGRALPASMRAERLGERARSLGMDWQDAHDVLAKVREELGEAEGALSRGDHAAAAEEIGDMMLALANVPRFIGRDAEQTLRSACDKFVARFAQVEEMAHARGVDLRKLNASEVDALWNEAKRKKRAPSPGTSTTD
jgi:MazG family protein